MTNLSTICLDVSLLALYIEAIQCPDLDDDAVELIAMVHTVTPEEVLHETLRQCTEWVCEDGLDRRTAFKQFNTRLNKYTEFGDALKRLFYWKKAREVGRSV